MGSLLFYAHAMDLTMLHALNVIASKQAKPTENTIAATIHLLDYCAGHQNAAILFRVSDMVLWVISNAAYLTETEARSLARGHFFLSGQYVKTDLRTKYNDTVNIICIVMQNVMASAAEAELGLAYLNAREAAPMQTTLKELGHLQPQMPIVRDNSTMYGIATNTAKQKRSKAMDIQFY
mmetsp:Transcript_14913/g.18742  ORF Transcript_14913/g.18742 Transcript_14913/m.18742 type:complete len:179 (-) Transcript_14913:238-774(-)